MNFRSDNEVGAHPRIVEAVSRAFASGSAPSYGADDWTHRVEHRLRDLFEKPDLVAFPVATGTAANVLSLACCTPPWGAIYCHPQAHIAVDEANAPEFFTAGAKLCLIEGPAGKIDPKKLAEALAQPVYGVVHHPQPAAVSITQATECGAVYAPEEIAALASSTHRHGLKLHMDGARFANALSFVGCAPAELSWKAGVDVLSLGATKNGALAAEAVVFFDAGLAREFEFRRKRGGHLLSKMRFLSAQLDAYLADGLWLDQRAPCQRHGAPAGGRADGAQGHAASLPGRRQRDLRGHAGAHARCAAGRGRAVPSLAVGPAGRARLPPRHGLRYRSQGRRPLPLHRQGRLTP